MQLGNFGADRFLMRLFAAVSQAGFTVSNNGSGRPGSLSIGDYTPTTFYATFIDPDYQACLPSARTRITQTHVM